MNTEILVVEDDAQIRNFISFALKSQGYGCIEAETGREAMAQIAMNALSAIILDLGLPDLHGLEIIKKVRGFSSVPIIVVSAHDQDRDKVEALDMGADDYLTKPFSMKELLARIRVVLRHQTFQPEDKARIRQVGDLELDLDKHRVTLEGKEIHLTPMEFDIVSLLVQNPGKVLTHKFILKEVWGSEFESDLQSVRVFMANIRRKLEKDPTKPRYVFTEVGIGYRFADE